MNTSSAEQTAVPDDRLLIDDMRRTQGYMTVSEVLALTQSGNVVLDPYSTLISRRVRVGGGNQFYPNCVIRCADATDCQIGDGNIFYPMTLISALEGPISIGHNNQFGPGGFAATADRGPAAIEIGDKGRYSSGVQLFAGTTLGNGSQIHGQISVFDCELGAGQDHTHPDPDLRGGVLKGAGAAKKLHVGAGEVIVGVTTFDQSALQRQLDFHPRA